MVSDWSPRKGPCSGGTLVVVTGSDLHYGSRVNVMMNRRPAVVVRLILCNVLVLHPERDANYCDLHVC